MKRLIQYTGGGLAGMALLSLALISGQVSFPTSHASSETAQASSGGIQSIAPAAGDGFTAVAKSVTPAVVNITIAAPEKLSDAPDFRDRMEEFFALLEWPAMAISLAAAYLLASQKPEKRVIAFWLLIVGNVMWIAWGWGEDAWALIALNVGLMVLNVRGIAKNEHAEGVAQ